MKMRPPLADINEAEFQHMIAGARVLEHDHGKPTAMLDASGARIIKIMASKSGFSSDRVWPYGYRFYFNCQKLLNRGIEAPRIERYCILRPSGLHVLVYDYLAGEDIQSLAEQGRPVEEEDLAAFYAELHAKGISFRSIHPGNILQLDDGRFGLIDVTDTRFYKEPLSVKERVHNLLHAWRRKRNKHVFPPARIEILLKGYCKAARLSARREQKFMQAMRAALAVADSS